MVLHTKVAGCVLGVVLVGLGAGCAGLRTELKGRDVGRAICDIKNADNANDAQNALDKANRKLDDAQRITGRSVNQDVRDIQNNLNDLARHANNAGNTLAKQDVVQIQRNVAEVANNAPALVKRFYEGVSEGLGDCD
ncbi:MAG TPA: hypothetical protein VGI86_16315 [Acidimicrobiia bacterium]|jgi:hypothetical protein